MAKILDELEARKESAWEQRERLEYEGGRLLLSGESLKLSYDEAKRLSDEMDKAIEDASTAQNWFLGSGGADPEGFDAFWKKHIRVVTELH